MLNEIPRLTTRTRPRPRTDISARAKTELLSSGQYYTEWCLTAQRRNGRPWPSASMPSSTTMF